MDDVDDDEVKSCLDNVKRMIAKGQSKVASGLLPTLTFESNPGNLDSDDAEYFANDSPVSFELDLNNPKHSIQVGLDGANIILKALVTFALPVRARVDISELNDWLSDNGGYAAGFISGGWSYHGDEGAQLFALQ